MFVWIYISVSDHRNKYLLRCEIKQTIDRHETRKVKPFLCVTPVVDR